MSNTETENLETPQSEEVTELFNLNKKLSEQNINLKQEVSRLAMANDAFIKTITVKDALLSRLTAVLEKTTDQLWYFIEDQFAEEEQVEVKNADDFFSKIDTLNASDSNEGWDDFLG